MRWIFVAAMLAMVVTAQAQETGGYRLFSKTGNISTTPKGIMAAVDLHKVILAKPTSFESGNGLIIRAVAESERIIRRAPPANATNVQRQDLLNKKHNEIQLMIDQLVGKPVTISVGVIDIVSLEEPPNESDAHKLWEAGRMMVVGKLNWASAMTYTEAERKQIAAANQGVELARQAYAEKLREIQKELIDGRITKTNAEYDRKRAADGKQYQERKAKDAIDTIRHKAESRRPVQMIYVMGSDAALTTWRRGQTRNINGVIQKLAMFTYNTSGRDGETLDAANIGAEAVVWTIGE